jgi:hypothetical protein
MSWRRLLILDLALVAALVAGVVRIRRSWNEFNSSHKVENIHPEKEPVLTLPVTAPAAAAIEDWTGISVNDPFSFDRNDIAIVAPTRAPVTDPKPVLFGTMAIGNERIAMLAPGDAGRASRRVKVGESLDSWQVVEINDKDVIVVASNGVREKIIINDPKARVGRSFDRTGPAAAAAPAATVVTPPSTPDNGAAASRPASAQTGTQPNTPAQSTDEILLTPFGPVRRTKP